MKQYIKEHNRILSVLLALVIAISAIGGIIYENSFKTRASYDPDKAITYGEFCSKVTIPDKYFFVGTYLFSLDVISDEIYEKALDSQSEMNQFNEYYKSELAGGIWYDISDADDLTNITINGTKVDENEQKKLYVTVYIDDTGKVHDAKTMASITLFDKPNPYDMKEIPELNTLYTQYKALFSENDKGVNLFYYEQLKSFFETDFRNVDGSLRAETDKLDRQLQNLKGAYESLQTSEKPEEAEEVLKLMKRVDNARRALIYKKLAIGDEKNPALDYELNKLLKVLSNESDYGVRNIGDEEEIEQSTMPYDVWTNEKKQYTYNQLYEYVRKHDGLVTVPKPKDDEEDDKKEEDKDEDEEEEDGPKVLPDFKTFFEDTRFFDATADKEEFHQNDAIISTIHDADADCKSAYDKYTSESLASPDSHIGKATYNIEEAIFTQAESGYSSAMDQQLEELVMLNNVAANVVKDKDKELAKVKELLPECESGFSTLATGGAGEDYSVAISQGANDDGLTSALEDQGAKLNKEMTELEFVITAYRMRVTPKECFSLTLGWIDATDALAAQVTGDAFAKKAKLAINTHKAWLTDLLEQLVKEDASLQSELDKLKEQKEELNEQKQKALDDNDLNGAKKIDAKLEEIDKRIDEELAKVDDVTKNDAASASDKAAAAVGLNGTIDGAIQDIKKDALDKMSNGEDASDEMNALEQLGATDAIEELKDAKTDAQMDSTDSSDKSGMDSSAKKKSISNLSEAELLSILEDVLGGTFENLDASGKVVAAVALEWAGDAGNTKAKTMAKNFIQICATDKNIYVYDTYLNGATIMVNLNTIGQVTDYRYVYRSAGKEGTLAKGTESYKFNAGSKAMKLEATKAQETMACAASLKYGTLYIPSSTVKDKFELSAEVIKDAQYSAVLDSKMETRAKELLDAFKNGGKE